MTTNNYQRLNLNKDKNKVSKQLEQEQNHRNGGLSAGMGKKENGVKGTENEKHNW